MEKSFIEKAIKAKALERYESDLRSLVSSMMENPIAKRLKINFDGEEKPTTLFNFGGNYGLINADGGTKDLQDRINLEAVKQVVLEQYEKEETKKILDKLDNLDYLFNQGHYDA